MSCRILSFSPESFELAVGILRKGGLIAFPTDTVYGLAADPGVAGGEDRIRAAKSRPDGKPIPLLADSVASILDRGAVLNSVESRLAEECWPGPLTLVIRSGSGREEGFRVPSGDILRGLLKAAGGILRVTSANRSGESPAETAGQVAECLGRDVELVLDGGVCGSGIVSSVVRVGQGAVEMIRQGAYSLEYLNKVAFGLEI